MKIGKIIVICSLVVLIVFLYVTNFLIIKDGSPSAAVILSQTSGSYSSGATSASSPASSVSSSASSVGSSSSRPPVTSSSSRPPATTTRTIAAPSRLAEYIDICGGEITIEWSTVNAAIGYDIYRGTSFSGTFTKIVDNLPAQTNFTNVNSVQRYTDTGLTPGTTYYYRIKTQGSTSESPYSATLGSRASSACVPIIGDNDGDGICEEGEGCYKVSDNDQDGKCEEGEECFIPGDDDQDGVCESGETCTFDGSEHDDSDYIETDIIGPAYMMFSVKSGDAILRPQLYFSYEEEVGTEKVSMYVNKDYVEDIYLYPATADNISRIGSGVSIPISINGNVATEYLVKQSNTSCGVETYEPGIAFRTIQPAFPMAGDMQRPENPYVFADRFSLSAADVRIWFLGVRIWEVDYNIPYHSEIDIINSFNKALFDGTFKGTQQFSTELTYPYCDGETLESGLPYLRSFGNVNSGISGIDHEVTATDNLPARFYEEPYNYDNPYEYQRNRIRNMGFAYGPAVECYQFGCSEGIAAYASGGSYHPWVYFSLDFDSIDTQVHPNIAWGQIYNLSSSYNILEEDRKLETGAKLTIGNVFATLADLETDMDDGEEFTTSGNITVTPHEYWTYDGQYDPGTGSSQCPADPITLKWYDPRKLFSQVFPDLNQKINQTAALILKDTDFINTFAGKSATCPPKEVKDGSQYGLSDAAARRYLKAGGINEITARYVGTLTKATLDKIIAIKNSSGAYIRVSGGTESSGHKSHGSNKQIVDLSYNKGGQRLYNFITSNANWVSGRLNWGGGAIAYCINTGRLKGIYVHEYPNQSAVHWHVVYGDEEMRIFKEKNLLTDKSGCN